nr:putative F-box and FNIP repeat-containing protein [Megavirus caiporensis]
MNKNNDHTYVFLIPIYTTEKLSSNTPCVKCINSIRKFYPIANIIIINDSPADIISNRDIKNYFSDINLDVIHPETKGSACSYALNYLADSIYDYGIVIHDSTEIVNYWDELNCLDFDVKFLWFFNVHYKWDKVIVPLNARVDNVITHTDEIMQLYPKLSDSQFKKDFLDWYKEKNNWQGCFGNMVIVSKKFLLELDQNTQILSLTNHVKTRRDRMCMESIFAMAVFYVKRFDVKNESSYAIQGNWCIACSRKKVGPNDCIMGTHIAKYSYSR